MAVRVTMKFISLFSGVGGFDLALEREGHECVYANDIDKYCKIIYDRHFKTKLDLRSIREVTSDSIPDAELLVGGFPCQAFSIAGNRRGFEDTRGTLFFEIARILKEKRIKYILLENVKGLLSHDRGETFRTIISALDELGYDLQWQVLNSKYHRVPQSRDRIYIVGHIRGVARPKIFPIREGDQAHNGVQRPVTNTVTTRSGEAQSTGSYIIEGKQPAQIRQINITKHQQDRVYSDKGLSPTLHTSQGGNSQPYVALTAIRTDEAKEIRRTIRQRGGGDYSPRRNKKLVARSDGKIGIITTSRNEDNLITDGLRIRRLTPLEYERLQGFPDNWTEGVSDSQRYKMMGNAVTVDVVQYIAKHL